MNSCLSTAKVKDTTTLTEDELSASEFLSGLSDFPQTIYDDVSNFYKNFMLELSWEINNFFEGHF